MGSAGVEVAEAGAFVALPREGPLRSPLRGRPHHRVVGMRRTEFRAFCVAGRQQVGFWGGGGVVSSA